MALRPGVVRALRRTLALQVQAHVVSRCHLRSQAADSLAATGLRVQGRPDVAPASPAQPQPSSSRSGQPAMRIAVHGAEDDVSQAPRERYVLCIQACCRLRAVTASTIARLPIVR